MDDSEVTASTRSGFRWTIVLGLFVSALFLWLTCRGMDWDAVRGVLGSVSWQWVLAYLVAALAIQLIRVSRWVLLLVSLGEPRIAHAFRVGAVGIAGVFFLPARLGELVRPVWISRGGGTSFGEAVSTVVVERMIDGIMVGLMLVVVGWGMSAQSVASATVRHAGIVVGGSFAALSLGLLVAARFSDWSIRIIDKLCGRWPRVQASLTSTVIRFRSGLFALMRSRYAVPYIGLTAAVWIGASLAIVLLATAVGVEIPWLAAFVVIGATAIGGLLPAAPTAVGTLHFSVIWALSLFGFDDAVGLNIAVLFHLCQVFANLLLYLGGVLFRGPVPTD